VPIQITQKQNLLHSQRTIPFIINWALINKLIQNYNNKENDTWKLEYVYYINETNGYSLNDYICKNEYLEYLVAFGAALVVGLAKAGLKGTSVLGVVLLALVFGSKASTGIMLILLLVGDVLAVLYYKRHVKWNYLFKYLPAIIIGILIAVFIAKDLNDDQFKFWMALIIFLSVIIMLWKERSKNTVIPNNWLFAGPVGLATGFATMIGNLASGFANLFFLSTGLPKNEIIGTSAWLFLIINAFKLPFHIFSWETISMETVKINIYVAPGIFLGFYLGIKLVKMINEKQFRYFLIGVTALGAIMILIK